MWLSILNLCISSTSADPAYPVWPNAFRIDFNETNTLVPIVAVGETEGYLIYDYNNKKSMIHREHGDKDRYCALNGLQWFKDQPCDHYVENGDRYIDYPQEEYCCYCCSADHGCGMLFPTWMENATFLGEAVREGYKTYKWDKKGVQDNFYYETIHDDPLQRKLVAIDQEPDELTDYHPDSFSTLDANTLIEVPARCQKGDKCPLASVCTALRGKIGTPPRI